MSSTLLSLLLLVLHLREVHKLSNHTSLLRGHFPRLVIPFYSEMAGTYYKPLFKLGSRHFQGGRLLFTAAGISTFQVQRLLISGDVSPNPGPKSESTAKYLCGECAKPVRGNQNAILCADCNTWSHVRCLKMSSRTFQYYLNNPSVDWISSLCALPDFSDSFFSSLNSSTHHSISDTEPDFAAQPSDIKLIRNGYGMRWDPSTSSQRIDGGFVLSS